MTVKWTFWFAIISNENSRVEVVPPSTLSTCQAKESLPPIIELVGEQVVFLGGSREGCVDDAWFR